VRHIALQGRQQARVPRGVVRLFAQTGNGTGLVLQAWAQDQQLPDEWANPTRLVLHDVTEETVVRVRPTGASAFAEHTLVRLSLRIDAPTEQFEITVRPVDVGSLPLRDLVSVEPDGDGLRVTARDAVRDLPVNELARRARGEARRRLGYDRVRDARAVCLAVGVDVSASMAHARRDGSLRDAVEVLIGLSQVVGDEDEPPRLCLLGQDPTWLPPVDLMQTAADLAGRIDEHGYELGAGSRLPPLPGRRRTVGFAITDGVPADFVPGPSGPVGLVVVGGGVTAEEVAGGRITALPAPGEDLTPARLTAVVGSLLQHCEVTDP
jgi:hypothetical protein